MIGISIMMGCLSSGSQKTNQFCTQGMPKNQNQSKPDKRQYARNDQQTCYHAETLCKHGLITAPGSQPAQNHDDGILPPGPNHERRVQVQIPPKHPTGHYKVDSSRSGETRCYSLKAKRE